MNSEPTLFRRKNPRSNNSPVLVSVVSVTIYGGWSFGAITIVLVVSAWKPVSDTHPQALPMIDIDVSLFLLFFNNKLIGCLMP